MQVFLSYKLRLGVLFFASGGVCCRAGSSQVSVRCERHSLGCDSAVDRGGSGGLLPGPLQTQQTQQGTQGRATLSSQHTDKVMRRTHLERGG